MFRMRTPSLTPGRGTWRVWLDDLAQDARFGLRSARHAPLFVALTVVTIALGIGVNAAVFGVVKSVLLDALPYADASRLVRVHAVHRDSVLGRAPLSAGEAADIAKRARSLLRTSSFRESSIEQTYRGAGGAPVVSTATVDGGFFGTLGVTASFRPSDRRVGRGAERGTGTLSAPTGAAPLGSS
jgi:hypothetical protein